MEKPPWAEADLCEKIAVFRQKGEGPNVEFKVEMPQQADRLGRSIAAMATSGGGLILVGVQNDKSVVGLPLNSEGERDELKLRVQGIVRNVRPPVKCRIGLGADDGKTILVIDVDATQDHPVFYSDGRPYIRHGSECRIAEPDQVQQKVWEHPSAEHAKRMQDIKFQKAKSLADSGQAFLEASNKKFL